MEVDIFEIPDGEYIAPGVKLIDDAIWYSDDIVDLAKQMEWQDSLVIGDGEEDLKDDARTSSSMPWRWTDQGFLNPGVMWTAAQAIYLQGLAYSAEQEAEFAHMEAPSLLYYKAGDGKYDTHTDWSTKTPRQFSAVLYLNDVEDGGETYFHSFDLAVEPRAGRLILFPANYVYAHQARPPKSGDKFVMVTWFSERLENLEQYYGN